MNSLGDVLEELMKRKAKLMEIAEEHDNTFRDGVIQGYAHSISVIVLAIEGEKTP